MIIMLIIVGQAGGNHYSNKGACSNNLCLQNDPDNGELYSYANDVLYGVEYDAIVYPTGFPNKPLVLYVDVKESLLFS